MGLKVGPSGEVDTTFADDGEETLTGIVDNAFFSTYVCLTIQTNGDILGVVV